MSPARTSGAPAPVAPDLGGARRGACSLFRRSSLAARRGASGAGAWSKKGEVTIRGTHLHEVGRGVVCTLPLTQIFRAASPPRTGVTTLPGRPHEPRLGPWRLPGRVVAPGLVCPPLRPFPTREKRKSTHRGGGLGGEDPGREKTSASPVYPQEPRLSHGHETRPVLSSVLLFFGVEDDALQPVHTEEARPQDSIQLGRAEEVRARQDATHFLPARAVVAANLR